ncbi:protein co-occurring with transport systems (COG1739) [Leucobacter sp. 7(1)]|uniref:YigZ family protein n=1 Tax=Leucobacter sp. 7(1) TaxID=1255613 RepID=UPI00097F368E|nr:YigZ family protein [Leucobacter sp. 7(1)]SJN12607.1 protein co-occurring with transport systems (COG1739) [Leucobacter sp. 7(1)]
MYETIRSSVDAETEISRSRFLTRLERVTSEEEARAVIARVRAEHPRARHHCSAFVLGAEGRIQRSNDDGEPSGTAGAPMLDALTSAGLHDVVAVVTRYFGGVLLGAGGLTRAYRASVADAVHRAHRVQRAIRHDVTVHSSYDVAAQIEAEARRRGYGIGAVDYTDHVAQRFSVAETEIVPLAGLVAELSAGAAEFERGPEGYVDLPGA